MMLSIHDVPTYERHLLFCSTLDQGRRPRRHGHGGRNVPTLIVALTVRHGGIAAADPVPLAIACNSQLLAGGPQPLGWIAAAPVFLSQPPASLAALCVRS